jgi:hypothetical protein
MREETRHGLIAIIAFGSIAVAMIVYTLVLYCC